MLHLAERKKGALATGCNGGGGVLTLFALLAILLAGCNLDGDSGGSSVISHGADESGSGYLDSSNVYHVYSAADLEAWAASYSTYSCTLHACIALSGEWEPVAADHSSPYTATFDGGGHTIYNLAINKSSDDYVGFFGCIGSGGEVGNLTLEDLSVSGAKYVGAIVGHNYGGTIDGCTVSGGTVTGYSNYVGGIAGYNDSDGTVKNSENSAAVSGSSNYVGGVAGNNYGEVTDCNNSGTVSGGNSSNSVGGVAGSNGSSGTVSGCKNSGTVSGDGMYVGGIAGQNYGEVTDCTNSGAITGSSYRVGGVAGNNYGEVADCTNSGTVSGSSNYVGGIAGSNGSSGTVSGCKNSGTVSGSDNVGGIAGYNGRSATVKDCDNSGGTVSGSGDGTNIGAVVGYNYGTVSNCEWRSSTAEKGIGGSAEDTTTSYTG